MEGVPEGGPRCPINNPILIPIQPFFQGPQALHLLYWQHEEQMGECIQEHQGEAGGRVSSPVPSKHSLFSGSLAGLEQRLLVPRLFWRTLTCSRSTPTRRSHPATSVLKFCEGTLARGSSASSVGRPVSMHDPYIYFNLFVPIKNIFAG